jgi:hypothetical protein
MNKLRGVVLGSLIWIVYRLISMTWRGNFDRAATDEIDVK